MSAITRYHREGWQAAWNRLDTSLRNSSYWGARGSPQSRGWADAIRTCFRTYHAMAQLDARPTFTLGLDRNVDLPPDELGVHVDVVLLDPRGYVPRLILWDTSELTGSRGALYAAPVFAAVEAELGHGRVPEVEVWHLRTRTEQRVSPGAATAALADVERVVHRLAGRP